MIIITKLSELKKLPEEVHDTIVFNLIGRNEIITHLKHLKTKKVYGNVDLSRLTKLKTLEGIGTQYLTEIHGDLILPFDIKSHLLSILKIKKLTDYSFKRYSWNNYNRTTFKVIDPIDILDKYRETRDILECQQELFRYGYREHAR